ncbi:PREDICTED: metal transporter CNNM4-like [Amphimedon queenslandica]|uniref:CNNM transmembrane domain-containing protein n=1 Tax=Amphimedon queenslandica TaxID=400682 RepID=A0A1X7VF55_AMPQE|nr:PREDICTED: metal transporter CNNM4-like [Amphimedon queenslandica]|eukprot:XP_003384720.1 PREDICTED: metal transporter CNNM4-like [Amphimedon queenslandica]
MYFSCKHKHFVFGGHGRHISLSLVFFLLVLTQPSWSQLVSFVPQGSKYETTDTGVISLDPTLSHSLLVIGYNLTNSSLIKWTESSTNCDEASSLFGTISVLRVTPLEPPIVRSLYNVTFPLISTNKVLYFCLRNDDNEDFTHQGTDLQLVVSQPSSSLLPLPVTIIFILILMVLSGLFSGLNLGLMALDPTTLKIVMRSGSKKQQRYAKIIHRVRRYGNYLLCTLLLGNVLVNSTFTILLDNVIGSGIYAVIGSTLAIVIFGEIVPQAICSRYGLLIGAYTIWLTYIFMVVTFPLAFPISLILNLILGKEIGAVYNRQQLLELLKVTKEDADINDYELGILSGALNFKDRTVTEIMTKYEHVFCVDIDMVLNFETMKQIYDSGFSRMPIYEEDRNNIVGILHLRDLTFIDPEDCIPIRQLKDFYNRHPNFVFFDTTLEKQLKDFVDTGCHIAIVKDIVEVEGADNEYKILGIITLEDIIEAIIGRQIVDEYDQFEDNKTQKKRKRDNNIAAVTEMMYTTPVISLSPQQVLAVTQFLSSSVPPFNSSHITKNVLSHLLRQDIVFKLSRERSDFLLYQSGTPANYFTLILEGMLLVTIGEEGLQFQAHGFYTFGSKCLLEPYSDTAYVPDFTVSMGPVECLVVIVTKRRYLAALKASRFENEQSQTVSAEVFNKEWEVAETTDLEASLAGKAGLTNITHLLRTKPLQGLSIGASHSNSNGASTAGSPLGGPGSLTHSTAESEAPLIDEKELSLTVPVMVTNDINDSRTSSLIISEDTIVTCNRETRV